MRACFISIIKEDAEKGGTHMVFIFTVSSAQLRSKSVKNERDPVLILT